MLIRAELPFGLAPRLNAAGRIDDPMEGFRLLSSRRLSDAIPIARLLEEQNRQRQALETQTIQDAQEMIKTQIDLSSDKIIVLSKEGWNPGVIGIAASKIVEKYYRPCLLIAIQDGIGVGSARELRDSVFMMRFTPVRICLISLVVIVRLQDFLWMKEKFLICERGFWITAIKKSKIIC